MDIEILSINENDGWPKSKQTDFEQLKVINARILDKKIDLTNGFTEDLNHVVAVYARYGDSGKSMCWDVCKLSPKFDEVKLQSAWDFFVKDNQIKSNRKLTNLCKANDIDTTLKTDGPITDADELAAYLPAGVDPRFVLEWGFYAYEEGTKCGYYFKTGEKTFAAQSNFVLTPLMHVYSKGDNKRIISISNGFKQTVLDMPSRAMISLEQFTAACYEEGNFIFWGSKVHLMRILNTINDKFIQCTELRTLGWQPEGFFAWSNSVYIPKENRLEDFNNLGVAEIDEVKYFSPAASSIYKNQRADDDEYENDRYLSYKKSAVTFEDWAVLFNKVYPEQSIYGIGFIFIGLFKDVIFKIDNNCPHLSAYGQKGSGKSKFAESISAIFLNDLLPFNLSHGTDFAFFNRLSRFKNCVTWLDEFDDAAIKEDRFQSIKGAYDGAGRERGKGTNKNRTEVAKVNSALMLIGQYLSTRDDNSALSRCIILAFTPDDNRSDESVKNYEALKQLEKKGLSSLLPNILKYRDEFAKEYPKSFPETFSELRELVNKSKGQYKERVLRNYTAIANCFKFFSKHIQFPFTYNHIMKSCAADVIKLSTLISESDSLADFWNTVEFLMELGEIYDGYHFKITEQSVIVINNGGESKTINLNKPTKLLYIRLTTIHKLYLESYRKQTGKTGINKQSLELYISTAKGYFGKNSSQRFTAQDGSSTVTSSYVFDYDLLGVPLERTQNVEQERHLTKINGHLNGAVNIMDVAGKPKIKFGIKETLTYPLDGIIVKKEVFTTVYSASLHIREIVESGQALVLTGVLKEIEFKDKDGQKRMKRTMEADLIELANEQMSAFIPVPDAPTF